MKKVSVSGGAPVTIADVAEAPDGASWGVDDTILFEQPEGIMAVPAASGTAELLIAAQDGEATWSPRRLPGDDDWVLFTVRTQGMASWDEGQVVVQSVTTGERTVLVDGGRDGRYLPTGHLAYVLNNVLFAVPFDLDSRQVTGGPVPLVEGVRVAGGNGNGVAHFTVSANGSLVYLPGSAGGDGAASLVWVDRAGQEEIIPAPPRQYRTPRVSPDGTRIAVVIPNEGSGDIWILDLEQETLRQLTFDQADEASPLWTPDSTRVVFTTEGDDGGLSWKAADGTGQTERLQEFSTRVRAHSWSADGRLIFELQEPSDVGALTVNGERTVEMLLDADHEARQAVVSPDGRWIAYLSDETGDVGIYVRPFPNIGDGK